jgi:molybdate transport system ATP-binding protein
MEAKAPELRLPSEPWKHPDAVPFIKIRDLVKKFDGIIAVDDVSLDIYRGEFFSLLGPSGCGKTTLLRMLAGFEEPTAGTIEIDGVDMAEVPPYRRPVNMMFQSYALFPHMTVEQNVAFGLKQESMPRAEIARRVDEMLNLVQLTDFAKRKPHQLSGGQKQRVALARALATEPQLLLLDEPLAALDARTRLDTRAQLRGHLRAHPGATVLVTHDPLDAMMLADRLVIVEDGAVVQTGDAATITTRPRTDYVARLVGLNLYRGRSDATVVRLPGDFTLTTATAQDGEVFVAFPPAAVALFAERPDGSPRNTWPAVVETVSRHGDNLRIELRGPITVAADVTPGAAVQLELAPGRKVWAALKATEATSYPA